MLRKILKIFFTIIFLGFFIQNALAFDYILGVQNEKNILKNKSKILDLDVLDNKQNLIKKLKQKNKFLIGYINVGAIENYREDYKSFPKSIIGKIYPGWEDENFLDIKNYKKFEKFILKRLDIAKEKGFDAIEPDNIDIFDNFSETGFKISKNDVLIFLDFLEKQTHKRGLKIFQKNAPELSKKLVKNFDGAIVEGGFYNKIINEFLVYIENEKSVYNIEYSDNISEKFFLINICPKSQKMGVISILKNRDLDEFILNCPYKKNNNKNILDEKLKEKINKILVNFYKKLDKKYLRNSKRVLVLEEIISKIKNIKMQKSKSNKLINILNYLEKNILERIKKYKNI